LQAAWDEYAKKYIDQGHLYNTLSTTKPELLNSFNVKVNVANSVQLDQMRLLKPEIIGFLCRILRNTKIDVDIDLVTVVLEDKLLTDEQKLQAMMKKNPSLQRMRNIFNLDFNS
jgi:DNA polymerase III subunit gamma/tau